MNFIEKQSIGISALFRKGLIIDFVLKSGVILSLILLIFLFRENVNMTAFNIALILSTVILMIFQYKYFREIGAVEDSSIGLREAIMKKIDYFNKKYVNAIYIAALSSPLLVISGMMYYFYLQYGRIRPLDAADVFVLGSTVFISFVMAAFVQIKQFRFHIRQLETCLQDLDEDTFDEMTITRIRHQRLRVMLIAVFALTAGILMFLYISAQ